MARGGPGALALDGQLPVAGVGGLPELPRQLWIMAGPAAFVAVGRYLQLSDDQIIHSHLFM